MPKFLYLPIVLAFALFLIIMIKDCVYDEENIQGTALEASAIGIVCGLVIVLIQIFMIPVFLPKKWVEDGSINLVSLREKTVSEGTFYLGNGSIAGIDYYTYYREWDGGYKKEKIIAHPSDSCKTSTVIYEHPVLKTGELKLFKRVFAESWYEYFGATANAWECKKYQFHIPTGSIRKEFVLE